MMYDDSLMQVGNKTLGTGRYKKNLVSYDKKGAEEQKAKASLDAMAKLVSTIGQILKRLLVSIVSGVILGAYFYGFYLNFYKRKMYDEMWQAMANHYQGLPEDRLLPGELSREQKEYWRAFNLNCRHLSTVNGIKINTMYEIKKIDSSGGVADPGSLLECIEVTGKYRAKQRVLVDAKDATTILRKYEIKSREFDVFPYPDILDEAQQDPKSLSDTKLIRENKAIFEKAAQKLQEMNRILEEKQKIEEREKKREKKIILDFVKAGIAQKNPIYYPFFINIPLECRERETIDDPNNPGKEIPRTWFYFEVEIVKRLGMQTSFVIGLVANPNGTVTDLSKLSEEYYKPNDEANAPIDPERYGPKIHTTKEYERFFKSGQDDRSKMNQPEWVTNHLMNNSKDNPKRLVDNNTYYMNEWRKIIPGELENSIGFDINNGKVKVSGGLTYVVDMREFLDKVQYPDSIYQTMRKKGTMEQEEHDLKKRQDNVDDEGYQFVGDSFGIAYNPQTGRNGE